MDLHDYWLHGITVFMGFFAMLNPIGNLPVYLGMVQGFDEKTQRRIARKAVMAAFAVVVVFSIFGHIIFSLFGITLPAFQIAGGVIVFIMGYQLLNASDSTIHNDQASHAKTDDPGREDIAIMPLGMPLLAGPGTISTAMNFVGSQKNIYNVALVIGVFAVICLITLALFVSGKKISERLSPAFLKVTSRIMGLILAVIAVQMMITGISGAYHLILGSQL